MGDLEHEPGVDEAVALDEAVLLLALARRAVAVVLARGRLADPARRELLWAGALHEVGMMVSHHDHHRHSAYLLSHVDAAGFSQSQLRRLGALVLGQRGGRRKVDEGLALEAFAWQVLCLRLAIIWCHARGDVQADALRLKRNGNVAALGVDDGWSNANPRTLHLLGEEAVAWVRGGPLKLELR